MSIELLPQGFKCGRACTYCYQEQPRQAEHNAAPPYDMAAMKAALEREGYAFTMFGGEPLLMPMKDLEELWSWGYHRFGAMAKARGNCPNSVQTDGYLLNDRHIDLIKRYEVGVGISIDGPGELNDARAMREGGIEATRAATAKTEAAIERLLAAGVTPSLIVTLHAINAAGERLQRLLEWFQSLSQKGIRHINLHLLEVDTRAAHALRLSEDEAVEAMLACARLQADMPISFQPLTDMWRLLRGEDQWSEREGGGFSAGAGCIWNACYDDKTEVLTRDGFKLFRDVDIGCDWIASIDPTSGEMSYQRAIAKQKFAYVGTLLHWHSRAVDLKVTPDHRLLVYEGCDWRDRPLVFRRADELRNPRDVRVRKDAIWGGARRSEFTLPTTTGSKRPIEPIPIETYLDFMGWYLSEGYFTAANWRGQIGYKIGLCNADESVRGEFRRIFSAIGLRAYENDRTVLASNKQLYEYVRQFGRSHEKYVPPEIKELAPDLIMRFLRVLFRGNGHRHEDGRLDYYRTASRRLADDVQELLLKVGVGASINVSSAAAVSTYRAAKAAQGGRVFAANHDQYAVKVIARKLRPRIYSGPKEVFYSGIVWDLTVPPHGTLFVRRNGKALWCSNCDPYTTDAVRGVDGQGNRLNCGRTYKEGVSFLKADTPGFERYVALYHTPQAYGGCAGCRFFYACKGQCPGTAEHRDWRGKTEHCGVLMRVFGALEASMLAAGEQPFSLSDERILVEREMIRRWSMGQWSSVTLVRRQIQQGGLDESRHGDIAHGDAAHGDAPHGDSHGDSNDPEWVASNPDWREREGKQSEELWRQV